MCELLFIVYFTALQQFVERNMRMRCIDSSNLIITSRLLRAVPKVQKKTAHLVPFARTLSKNVQRCSRSDGYDKCRCIHTGTYRAQVDKRLVPGTRSRTCTRTRMGMGINTFSTTTLDAKKVNEFARKNADLARRALEVPEIPISYEMNVNIKNGHDNDCNRHGGGGGNDRIWTWEKYLRFRKWDPQYIDDEMTSSLITHAASFPLTLAAHARGIFDHFISSSSHNQTSEKRQQLNIRLCCVGSRAEANLPDEYWREFLIASNVFNLDSDSDPDNGGTDTSGINEEVPINWTVDFVGPEISSGMKSRQITLPRPESFNKKMFHTSLTMNYHSDYLHGHVFNLYKSASLNHQKGNNKNNRSTSTEDILNLWDGFVLFNPGCGHPHLKKSWKPSLKFILKTKANILMTCHSELDGERDRIALNKLIKKDRMQEEIDDDDNDIANSTDDVIFVDNPFASRMSFEDPFPTNASMGNTHDVRPNHSIYKSNF